ncbi:MAG TPA: glutamine--fructose-6-phosphate transaminase (isomerizing) [Anaerolineaceae bacterium]|nr:glutamine--fructose-6-phosphate transaminase (isomerizing) [Anaerolineaceae bacterium]
MCGIVGYIGEKDATPIILNGLKKLEYRGYDSAGLAVIENGSIALRRDAGKLEKLITLVNNKPVSGNLGIGHTRWATHGVPSANNAHPHISGNGKVVLVHNGIVENFLELKQELMAENVQFQSDTDSETIVLLVERFLSSGKGLIDAARSTFELLRGAHGIVLISSDEPDKIVAARIGNAGGVVIGLGEDEAFVASDIPAILEHTRRMIFLESHQYAVVTRKWVKVYDFNGNEVHYQVHTVAWDSVAAEKGEYRHFMQKEIHEQVRSLTETMAGRINLATGQVEIPQLNLTKDLANSIKKIFITACGTAAHAGMVGKLLIERLAQIPVETEIASEFRYRDPIIERGSVVISISQSGETADTLAAMEVARRKGATLWSVVNAIGSQAMRLADGYISMQVGPEIGVASTKAFTAPLVDLYMLSLQLAQLRGTLSHVDLNQHINDLRLVPDLVSRCLSREYEIEKIALKYRDVRDMLYLGRGINMPIAYEGALKMKEISYIHAEAYPAGEMKHGPIALIDKDMPVVAIAPRDPWYEKMVSQIEQAKSRGGSVLMVATEGDERAAELADDVIWIPEVPWMLSPIITVIPLQMLAYHIASLRGLDVDQPRNLAKSVTVE